MFIFRNRVSERMNEEEPVTTNNLELHQNSTESPTAENHPAELDSENAQNRPTLFSRLFRNSYLYSGPETFYENEAWAPEQPQIRLFAKRRSTAEEQTSSSSGPQ